MCVSFSTQQSVMGSSVLFTKCSVTGSSLGGACANGKGDGAPRNASASRTMTPASHGVEVVDESGAMTRRKAAMLSNKGSLTLLYLAFELLTSKQQNKTWFGFMLNNHVINEPFFSAPPETLRTSTSHLELELIQPHMA